MKRYGLQHMMALIGLAAVCTAGVGCGSSSSSCGANVTAAWVVTENGAQVACLPGDEVDINVDSMNAPFDCSAMAGTTPTLAGGLNHNVSLTLLDSSANVLAQSSTTSVFVPCGTITDLGTYEFALSP